MYLYLFTSTAWKFICTVCSTVLHIVSSIRYQNAIYGNYFLNCPIVKRSLISFNCFFFEYIIKQAVSYLFIAAIENDRCSR